MNRKAEKPGISVIVSEPSKRMDPADAVRIEEDRSRVFKIKLRIVELLATARQSHPADLWSDCLDVISQTFHAEDVELCFRMDRYYIGTDSRFGVTAGPNAKMAPGGLTNLLEVIGHVEAELKHGLLARAKRSIPASLLQDLVAVDGRYRWRYFNVLNHPNRQAFDHAVEAMFARNKVVQGFWLDYRQRLNEAVRSKFQVLVPIEMMPQHARDLQALVQDYAIQIQAKRNRGDLVLVPEGRNIFRKDGNSWTIQFDTKPISKPDSVGLFYIAQILRSCPRILRATELRALYAAWRKDPDSWHAEAVLESIRDKAGESASGTLNNSTNDLGEAADTRTLRECRTRRKASEEHLTKAVKEGDIKSAAALQSEIDMIKAYLARSVTPSGAPRREKDAIKKANNAVRNAITRVLGDLEQAHPGLREHLRQFMSAKPPYAYSPKPHVDWVLM